MTELMIKQIDGGIIPISEFRGWVDRFGYPLEHKKGGWFRPFNLTRLICQLIRGNAKWKNPDVKQYRCSICDGHNVDCHFCGASKECNENN